MGNYAPTILLDEWNPNIPSEYLKTDPEKEISETGYVNFCHVQLEIVESEVLQLHHDGHIRFKVNNKGEYLYVAPWQVVLITHISSKFLILYTDLEESWESF